MLGCHPSPAEIHGSVPLHSGVDEPSGVGVNIWRLPLGHYETTCQRYTADLG